LRSLVLIIAALCVFGSGILLTNCSDTTCKNNIGNLEIDPNDGKCSTRCECNNQVFTGECVKGKCQSIKRGSCDAPGTQIACIDHVHKCEGFKTCKPPELRLSNWGDCVCGTNPLDEQGGFEFVEDAGKQCTEQIPRVEEFIRPKEGSKGKRKLGEYCKLKANQCEAGLECVGTFFLEGPDDGFCELPCESKSDCTKYCSSKKTCSTTLTVGCLKIEKKKYCQWEDCSCDVDCPDALICKYFEAVSAWACDVNVP